MKLNCKFETKRLIVQDWLHLNEDVPARLKFAQEVIRILTPEVTKSLPNRWQNIKNVNQANHWILNRANESIFLTVSQHPQRRLVGFIFLYKPESENEAVDLRFGYLLSQSVWGKGMGTELIT